MNPKTKKEAQIIARKLMKDLITTSNATIIMSKKNELLAEAEIERAKGVAEANRIIAEGLKDNEEYLRYLWIDKLGDNNQDVIYIPTEAGMPILEAQRLK